MSDSAVAKCKEVIPLAFKLLHLTSSWLNITVDRAAGLLRMALDFIAPLKKKIVKQRKLPPWYTPKPTN